MSRKRKFRITPDLAIYWADGIRNLLEISRLVKQEAGRADLKLLIDHFGMLERCKLIKLEKPPHRPP